MQVTPAVLVPRPETETVIESALDAVTTRGLRMEKLRMLDIGTGSGALLLALLSELPNATGIGTDISAEALDVARANAERHRARRALHVRRLRHRQRRRRAVRSHRVEPALHRERRDRVAAAGGARLRSRGWRSTAATTGSIVYRAIAADALRLLAPDGTADRRTGRRPGDAVSALFTKAGLAVNEPRKDLAGIARALSAKSS